MNRLRITITSLLILFSLCITNTSAKPRNIPLFNGNDGFASPQLTLAYVVPWEAIVGKVWYMQECWRASDRSVTIERWYFHSQKDLSSTSFVTLGVFGFRGWDPATLVGEHSVLYNPGTIYENLLFVQGRILVRITRSVNQGNNVSNTSLVTIGRTVSATLSRHQDDDREDLDDDKDDKRGKKEHDD